MPETPNNSKEDMAPILSVVVIGRNEGQRLARCLESVRAIREVGSLQILYVDSASTDNSPQLAGQYGAQVLVVHPERPTAAIGRNAGWRVATAEFVLFLDGDTVLHPDFPRAALDAMAGDETVAVVWGHRREIHPEVSLYNRVLDLDWVYPPGLAEFCGGDVLMRRRALQEVDGYDDRLIAGEEPEMCRRMRARGYKILHIDQPMTGHDLQMTRWSQYWKRATRAGHAYAEVSKRFRDSEDQFWLADRNRNLVRGGFWIASLVLAIAAAFRFGFLPLLGWILLVLLLSLRSAWVARWKGGSLLTLLLYGVHSQLQQVPIFIGQMQYELDQKRSRQRKLIEYKTP